MLLVGSDDGAYRVDALDGADESTATKVLDSERVMRLRTFESVAGVFAATRAGLYHSPDGETWTDLNVPREKVYAVGASPTGERLYAATRPAGVYATAVDGEIGATDPSWRELDGFQDLPSRGEWRLPRHENLAQVRDVHAPAAEQVVAGVEVGGVHGSDDGGETWTERRDGCDDDIHELHVESPEEWVAATGRGLFRTTDAGGTWARLDDGVEQMYFRSVTRHDGVVYASGAMGNSGGWDDPDADPALFAWDGTRLAAEAVPTDDETVTGFATVDGTLVAGTHCGTLLTRRADGWTVASSFPVPGETTGRYTPLASLAD